MLFKCFSLLTHEGMEVECHALVPKFHVCQPEQLPEKARNVGLQACTPKVAVVHVVGAVDVAVEQPDLPFHLLGAIGEGIIDQRGPQDNEGPPIHGLIGRMVTEAPWTAGVAGDLGLHPDSVKRIHKLSLLRPNLAAAVQKP